MSVPPVPNGPRPAAGLPRTETVPPPSLPAKSLGRILFAAALAVCGSLASAPARAEDAGLQERLDRLEQRYNILERKVELDQEAAAAKAKDAQNITANPGEGFTLRNADKSFVLKLAGYSQLDGRFYAHDKAGALADTFLVRRARLCLEGTLYKAVAFRIVPDFGGGTTALQDAYLNLAYTPAFQFRAGRFKVPFGLERLQASDKTLFVETAYTTALTPNYDNGVQVLGELWGGAASYAAAYTNGSADGASSDGDTADGKGLAARLFFHPFRSGGSLAWKDLGAGLAWTKDRLLSAGTATATGLSTYRTPGQQSLFAFSNSIVDGERVRWSPQAYWYPGRFGFLGEYVVSRAEVRRVAAPLSNTVLTNRAWQVQGSYTLTGETASYRGLKPLKPFDSAEDGGWGAWELAARYAEFRADEAAFQTAAGAATGVYANKTTQAQRARTWSGGVNWYLNNAVKIQAEYDHTQFTGGAPAAAPGSTDARKLGVRELLTRFQVSF